MDSQAWTEQVEATLDDPSGTPDTGFLSVLASIAPPVGDDLAVELVRARMQAAMGDPAAAAAALPAPDALAEQPGLHRAWAAAATDLALAGAIPNDATLGVELVSMADDAVARRAAGDALDILERHVLAALARGSVQVAGRGVDLAQAVIDPPDPDAPRLSRRRRKAAQLALDALLDRVQGATPPDPELPDTPDDLLAQVGTDAERDLERLHAALARWPAHIGLLRAQADAWERLDDAAAGVDAFALHVADHPHDVALAVALGRHLLHRGMAAALDAWVEQRFLADPEPAVQARGWELRARARLARAALPAARAAAEQLLALAPGDRAGRRLLARILRADGDEAGALDLLDGLAAEPPPEGAPEDGSDLDLARARAELGTLVGRWSSVRAAAPALGLDLPAGDGAVAVDLGPCRVHLPWTGETVDATRTGPATARLADGAVVAVSADPVAPDGAGADLRAIRTLDADG